MVILNPLCTQYIPCLQHGQNNCDSENTNTLLKIKTTKIRNNRFYFNVLHICCIPEVYYFDNKI